MKHILALLVIAFLAIAPLAASAQQREVRVTAAQANVYDAPRSDAELMGQLPRGKMLRATGNINGNWLEIEAPAEISGWVFGALMQGDVVEATNVRIRSGAGVGFEGIGTLVRGDRIRRRGAQGGWIEIEGTGAMRVWVEQATVSAPAEVDLSANARPAAPPVATAPAPEPRREPQRQPPAEPSPVPPPTVVRSAPAHVPPPAPAPVAPTPAPLPAPRPVPERDPLPPVRPAAPFLPPVEPDRTLSFDAAKALLPEVARLVREAPQGESVQMQGIVRPTGLGLFRPARYRLVSSGPYPALTAAYLIADTIPLERLVGRDMIITGRRFWLIGVRHPVVVLTAVQNAP